MFYVYEFLREDGSPYYIGKGHGNRAYKKRRKGTKPPQDISRIRVHQMPDEDTALAYEMYFIDFWGRKDNGTGILLNLTDGGEHPPNVLGQKRSEETKAKHRNWHKAMRDKPEYTNPLVAWTNNNPDHQSVAGKCRGAQLSKDVAHQSKAGKRGGRAAVESGHLDRMREKALKAQTTEDRSNKRKDWWAGKSDEYRQEHMAKMKKAREIKCSRGAGGKYVINR